MIETVSIQEGMVVRSTVRWPDKAPNRTRSDAVAKGRIGDRPFVAYRTDDPSNPGETSFRVVGHLLDENHRDAIRRAMEGVELFEHDLTHMPLDPLAIWEILREVDLDAYVWLGTFPSSSSSANRPLRMQGADYDGRLRCWFAMDGIDLTELEHLGCLVRPRPEWRRLEGDTKPVSQALKELGAVWDGSLSWFVDVAVTDMARFLHFAASAGIKVMETKEETFARGLLPADGREGPSEWDPSVSSANFRMGLRS
jgi:hypothetical protein